MISLNGIQIDEVELKRQLEAQGLSVVPTPEPSHPFKVGDIVWCQHKVEAANPVSYVISRALPGDQISDDLIRAYEKLHKYSGELGAEASCHNLFIISAAIYKKIQNMYGEINAIKARTAAIKAQGEKR